MKEGSEPNPSPAFIVIEAETTKHSDPNAALLDGVERSVFARVVLRYYQARWRLTRPQVDVEEHPTREPRFGFIEFCEHHGMSVNKLSVNDFVELFQIIAECTWEDLTDAKRSNATAGGVGSVQP